MGEQLLRIAAAAITSVLFCLSTLQCVGAMQQSGYKNGKFLRWIKRKDNLYFNRLSVQALCLLLACTVVSLCFSFLGVKGALLVSAAPCFILQLLFFYSDRKYALKVRYTPTNRFCRLFAVYILFVVCFEYFLIALLTFLAAWNGSVTYGLIAYAPFAVMPILLPALLVCANAVCSVFENAHNKKFVKRAGQVLDETKIIRVGIVGSYGKTSVKNILNVLLSEKYATVATPESFNTPIGIAKTVYSSAFENKQVLIAEMGARKAGDIEALCALVKPDYAIFTGVCLQHAETFGTIENVLKEKSAILRYGVKKAVCGAELKGQIPEDNVLFAKVPTAVEFDATETRFTLKVGGTEISVTTKLLGRAGVENIALAATLAYEMGLTAEEIARGIEKITPVPHRLQLLESGGAYVLDDGYNANVRGAEEALAALCRFHGEKCVVTPGIVECGILEESINGELGEKIANANLDKVILVGDTLVGAVKKGYEKVGGNAEKLTVVPTLEKAQELLAEWVKTGSAVLFLNDLPDVY